MGLPIVIRKKHLNILLIVVISIIYLYGSYLLIDSVFYNGEHVDGFSGYCMAMVIVISGISTIGLIIALFAQLFIFIGKNIHKIIIFKK